MEKNNQKGFAAQGMVIIIAIAVIAGIAYYFGTKKVVAPRGNDVVVNATSTVTDKPSITVLSPNGGENWKMGQTYNISYSVNGNFGPVTIKLNRYSDDGTLIQSFEIGTSDTNNITYKVPTNLEDTKGMAGRYKIEIYPATARELVARSGYFAIIPSSIIQTSLTVLSPNGNENWVKGSTKTIRWSNPSTQTVSGVGAPQDEIAIFINSQSTDTAPLAKTIVTGLNKNATSYDWTVGSNAENAVLNGSYYIKVCRKTFTCDWSDAQFTITQPIATQSVTVNSPNGGEAWKIGRTHTIQWTSNTANMTSPSVGLYLYDTLMHSVLQIESAVSSSGTYSWTIPPTLKSGSYKISAYLSGSGEGAGGAVQDYSDNYFTITN